MILKKRIYYSLMPLKIFHNTDLTSFNAKEWRRRHNHALPPLPLNTSLELCHQQQIQLFPLRTFLTSFLQMLKGVKYALTHHLAPGHRTKEASVDWCRSDPHVPFNNLSNFPCSWAFAKAYLLPSRTLPKTVARTDNGSESIDVFRPNDNSIHLSSFWI